MFVRTLLICLLIICDNVLIAQDESPWLYKDIHGNYLRVKNIASLPDHLDSLVFRNDDLVGMIADDSQLWDVTIVEMDRIKKNKTYDLKLYRVPLDASLEEAFQHQGFHHYECEIHKLKGDMYKVVSITFSYSEI